jgi:hypothetical protein
MNSRKILGDEIMKNVIKMKILDVCYRNISLIWLDKGVLITITSITNCQLAQLPQTKSNKFL